MKNTLRIWIAFLIWFCFVVKIQAQTLPSSLDLTAKGPDSFLVKFETTKGDFVMKSHRNWGPLASDRFYILAKNKYYNGCVVYRVAPTSSVKGGFVVQFGLVNDEATNHAWEKAGIKDEPVIHPHNTGTVCYARGGPDTRSTELAIAITPSVGLDSIQYLGVTGFPSFAEVVKGMEVIQSFNGQYGNSVFEHEDSLYKGREYFDRAYPGLDRINKVSVIKKW